MIKQPSKPCAGKVTEREACLERSHARSISKDCKRKGKGAEMESLPFSPLLRQQLTVTFLQQALCYPMVLTK